MQRNDRGTETRYLFKHALIQDTAYQMLLRTRRQEIHRDVARSLETHSPGRAVAEPELLAHHFEAGGDTERAVQLWLQASRHSLARSAVAEAITQAKQGLAGLKDIDPSQERDSLEIDLQTCMALASMAHHGYGADETEQSYRRAHELLGAFADDPRHIGVLHGFCAVLGTHAKFHDFMEIAAELLERAERSGDSASVCAGHRCMAVDYNSRGEFTEALQAATRAVEYFDPPKHRKSAQRFGHDVGVAAKMHLAIASHFLGFGDQASRLIKEALALAHDLDHPNTLGFAFMWATFLNLVARDLDAALESAETLERVSQESANPNWAEHSRHMSSAALAAHSETAARGVDVMSTTVFSANSNYFRPMYLCFQAEGLCHLDRYDEATASIDEALQRVDDSAERWWLAELHRTKGEILCAQGANAEAEACFSQALSVARAQNARLLELRAANAMARLWRDQGRLAEARDLLTPALLEQLGQLGKSDAAPASSPEGGNHGYSQTAP
jgi:tetratricopeptide (TPR) repeat protein